MISKTILRKGYKQNIVKLIESPYGDGVVCKIGEYWFYFGGLAAEDCKTVEEYTNMVPVDDILTEIINVLSELKIEMPDEYKYYDLYLKENVK